MKSPLGSSPTQWILAIGFTPFVVSIITTMGLVFLVGDRVPRVIAPGSSLVAAGLSVTLLTGLFPLTTMWLRWSEPLARRQTILICGFAALMSWPIWTMGVMPTVNGMRFGPVHSTAMRLIRQEIRHASRNPTIYHWAYLRPAAADSGLTAGRYFVPTADYDIWSGAPPRNIQVHHATGLLGAEILFSFHSRQS